MARPPTLESASVISDVTPGAAQGAGQAGTQPVTVGTPTAAGPVSGDGAPLATLGVRELRARRDEISRQLSNVASRRSELAGQLRDAVPGVDKAGLESRIATLDRRIVEMETDLATTGRLLQIAQGTNAGTLVPPPAPPGEPTGGQITAMSIVFFLAVLMPLSMAWGRAILRRTPKAGELPSREVVQRLERMEQSIEAIAIEVERISEGQRFVSRLLGQGAAQPVAVEPPLRLPVERDG